MASHQVNISVDTSYPDSRVLSIRDISKYNPLVSITNVSLRVILPSQVCAFYVPFIINGTNYYNSRNFGFTGTDCSNIALPDGLYDITYSVCPNEELYTNFKYLRTIITKDVLYKLLGNYLTKCEITKTNKFIFEGKDEYIEGLETLLLILNSAEADVTAGKFIQGQEKLLWVNKEILKITNNTYY